EVVHHVVDNDIDDYFAGHTAADPRHAGERLARLEALEQQLCHPQRWPVGPLVVLVVGAFPIAARVDHSVGIADRIARDRRYYNRVRERLTAPLWHWCGVVETIVGLRAALG